MNTWERVSQFEQDGEFHRYSGTKGDAIADLIANERRDFPRPSRYKAQNEFARALQLN